MTSWSSAQKKERLKEEVRKVQWQLPKSSFQRTLNKVFHGSQWVTAVKQLAATSAKHMAILLRRHVHLRPVTLRSERLDDATPSDWQQWERWSCGENDLSEFKEAAYYHGTEKDPARSRVHIRDNKTVGVHGLSVLWIYDDLHQLIDMYIRIARNQFLK